MLERLDRLRDLETVGDHPECAVEIRAARRVVQESDALAVFGAGDDEELRPGGSRGIGLRLGPRELARLVPVGREFGHDRVAGAAGAGVLRVAALDHEVGDDAVECRVVVEPGPGERHEVVDADRRVGGVERDHHVAARRVDRRRVGLRRVDLHLRLARHHRPFGQFRLGLVARRRHLDLRRRLLGCFRFLGRERRASGRVDDDVVVVVVVGREKDRNRADDDDQRDPAHDDPHPRRDVAPLRCRCVSGGGGVASVMSGPARRRSSCGAIP